jgi:MFS family permease
VAFAVFASAALIQIGLRSLSVRRTLRAGAMVVPLGLGLLVAGTWTANLPLFVIGGILSGAGAGLAFKGALATSIELAPAESRAEVLAAFFVASYVGLAIPVILLGVIGQTISARAEMAGFAAVATAALLSTVGALTHKRRSEFRPQPPSRSVPVALPRALTWKTRPENSHTR